MPQEWPKKRQKDKKKKKSIHVGEGKAVSEDMYMASGYHTEQHRDKFSVNGT